MTTYEIIPIHECIRASEKGSPYWFSRDTKNFFRSRWDNVAYRPIASAFAYFISSEKCGDDRERRYTIRRINMFDGNIGEPQLKNEIFEFQHWPDKKHALKALKEFLKQ
jgi:hypothetical protein